MISPKRLDDLMQVDSKVIHNLARLKQNNYQWISVAKSEDLSGPIGILYDNLAIFSEKSYKKGDLKRSYMTI